MNLVSIIIPVYNVESYINQCIDSVIQQTYKNVEIILVDDGSDDSCPRICDEYARKDPRIRVIHKPNGGAADARNAGLAIAKGEYIYFLDSDDYIEKDAIATLVVHAHHYDADVVFFDALILYDIPNPNYRVDFYLRRGLYENPLKGVDMLGILLQNDEYRSAVSLLFIRRAMLIDNNLSFYKGIVYEDELFTFLLFMQSKIVVHLPETLYKRRIRKNSIMNVRIKAHNFLSITVVASEMINFYLYTSESDYKDITRICINRILFYVKDVYQRLSVKDKIALDKELKRFENVLQFNNYLDSQEIKQACLNIRLVQFRDIIKKMLPRKLKTAMKNIAANELLQNRFPRVFNDFREGKDE